MHSLYLTENPGVCLKKLPSRATKNTINSPDSSLTFYQVTLQKGLSFLLREQSIPVSILWFCHFCSLYTRFSCITTVDRFKHIKLEYFLMDLVSQIKAWDHGYSVLFRLEVLSNQQSLTFVQTCTWKLTQTNREYASKTSFDYIAVSTQIIAYRHTEHC